MTGPPVTLAALEFRWADIYLICYAPGTSGWRCAATTSGT